MADRSHVESFFHPAWSQRGAFEVAARSVSQGWRRAPSLWRFPRISCFVTVFTATEEVKWTEAGAQRDADGEIDASQREKKKPKKTAGWASRQALSASHGGAERLNGLGAFKGTPGTWKGQSAQIDTPPSYRRGETRALIFLYQKLYISAVSSHFSGCATISPVGAVAAQLFQSFSQRVIIQVCSCRF